MIYRDNDLCVSRNLTQLQYYNWVSRIEKNGLWEKRITRQETIEYQEVYGSTYELLRSTTFGKWARECPHRFL